MNEELLSTNGRYTEKNMKTTIPQKIISALLTFVVFSTTSLSVGPAGSTTQQVHKTTATTASSTQDCLAPYASAVGHIMYENNRIRFENKVKTSTPIGLSIAEATFMGTSLILSATIGPQFAILALLPRVAWNTAIAIHGLGHTLAGAGAIFAGQLKHSPLATALGKAAAFVNMRNITENVGMARFLKTLIPLPFLVPVLGFDKTAPPANAKNRIGVRVVKDAGPVGVKIQAIAGMAANATVAVFGASIFIGGLLNLIPLALPATLAVVPFVVSNVIALLASGQDMHIFFKGPGNLMLMSNLLGSQVKKQHYRKDKKTIRNLFSSQIKFFPSGWEGQSVGIMLSSAGYFFVQSLKNMGRFELIKTIRRWGFWYANTSINILRTLKRAGKTPQADYMSFLMHLSSKDSKDAPDETIQPIATEKNIPAKKWGFQGKTLKADQMLWTNYIVHSGNYTGTKLFGTLRSTEHVRWYLQNVLHLDGVPEGDSPVVSMLMDLYTTKGNWSKSLRLAFQQVHSASFEKAFERGTIKKPAEKKKAKGLFVWLKRISGFKTPLAKAPYYNPSSGAPNEQVLATWESVFDGVFEKFATRYGARMCTNPSNPSLDTISEEYQNKLHAELSRAVLANPSLKRVFPLKQQADEFVRKSLRNFTQNDTFKATRMLMKKSTGSFGLFTGSTSELGNVLTALDKPLSVGLGGPSLSNIQRRGWSSHADMLKLLQKDNDPVYRWIYRLNDIDGEVVKLGENFEDIQVYNLKDKKMLSGQEVKQRLIDLKKPNELTTPAIKMDTGNIPTSEVLESYPEIFSKILKSWSQTSENNQPGKSKNLQTCDVLYEKIRQKAMRMQRIKDKLEETNISSKTYDITIIGDKHNAKLAKEFETSLAGLFPELNIKAIDADELAKNPKEYAKLIDADTINISLSHTGRRTTTYEVTKHLKWLEDQAGGKHAEGGVFAISSRWDTELAMLTGTDPSQNEFHPRVISTFSGRSFANPMLHSPSFLLTLLEMQNYIAQKLRDDADLHPELYGKYPLGMKASKQMLEQTHEVGRQIMTNTDKMLAANKSKKSLNKRLDGVGKKFMGYSHESLRVFIVAAGLVGLSIWLSLPLPFDLVYQFILLPLLPTLGTWSFGGVVVMEVFIRFLNIFFWEFSFFYVLWVIRFFTGHPVNLPKNGISKIYLNNKKDIGGGLIADFAQEVIDNNWLLRQFKDAKSVSPQDKVSRASLMLSSSPLNIPKSPITSVSHWNPAPKQVHRRRFRLSSKTPETFGFGNTVSGPKQASDHMLGYEEFDFYRDIQNKLNKIGPGLSGQSKKIVDSYDTLFRGMGYYSVIGYLDLHARQKGHWLANPFSALRQWIVSKLTRTHMRYPIGQPEPGLVSLLQILVTGTLGYSIIKGVLKQTLFAQATPAVLTLFLFFIVATLVFVPLFTWIKKEVKFFKRFFIEALIPKKQKIKKKPATLEADYSEIKRVLKKYSLKSRIMPQTPENAKTSQSTPNINVAKQVPEETISTTVAHMVRNGIEDSTDILETMLARLETTTDLDFSVEDLHLMVALRHEAQNGDQDLVDAIIVEMTTKLISQKGLANNVKEQAITLLNGSVDKLIEQGNIETVFKLFKALLDTSEHTPVANTVIEHIWYNIPPSSQPRFDGILNQSATNSTANSNNIAQKLLRYSNPLAKQPQSQKPDNVQTAGKNTPVSKTFANSADNKLVAQLLANPFDKKLPHEILKQLAANSSSFSKKDLETLQQIAISGGIAGKDEANAIITRVETLHLLQADTDLETRKKAIYHLGAILESSLLVPTGYSNIDTRNIFGILLESIRYTPEAKVFLERFIQKNNTANAFDTDRFLLDYLLDPSVFPAVKLEAIRLLKGDPNQQFETVRILGKQFGFFSQAQKIQAARKLGTILQNPHTAQVKDSAVDLLVKWLNSYRQTTSIKHECVTALSPALDNHTALNAVLDQLALVKDKQLVKDAINAAGKYLEDSTQTIPYTLGDLLTQTLDSTDPEIRIQTIKTMQHASATPLSTYLLDTNGYLYESFISHPSHNPTFSDLFEIMATEDPSPQVKAQALKALGYSRQPENARVCALAVVEQEQNPHLKLAAAQALCMLAARATDTSQITPALVLATKEISLAANSQDENTRLEAVKATSFIIKTIDGKGGRNLLKLRTILDRLFEDRSTAVASAATTAYADLAIYTQGANTPGMAKNLLENTLIKSVTAKHTSAQLKQSCAEQAGRILAGMNMGKDRNDIVNGITTKAIDNHTSAQTLGLLVTMLRPSGIQKAYPLAKTLVNAYDTITPMAEYGWAQAFASNPEAQLYKSVFMQDVYPAIFKAVMNNPGKSLVNIRTYIDQIMEQAKDKVVFEINASLFDVAA